MKINDFRFTFDDPVLYKNLKFYPIRMRDYYLFLSVAPVLALERSRDKNPIVAISMSRLAYLYYVMDEENNYLAAFNILLKMALGKKDDSDFKISYGYGKDSSPLFIIDGESYDSNDYENIREIIAQQNEYELPNENIQWTIREKMQEAREFKARISGNKYGTLEEQMIALSIYTGWDLDKIYNMTIRKFTKAIRRSNHMIYQDAYLNASLSGFVEFKTKDVLKSWLAEIGENDDSDVTVSVEEVQRKVSLESAKK